MPSTTVYDRIISLLEAAFNPTLLEVADDSHRHAGHAGARPEGETHFQVTLVSDAFAGESRVQRQRRVYAALGELMETRIHALQLTTHTPEEHARLGA